RRPTAADAPLVAGVQQPLALLFRCPRDRGGAGAPGRVQAGLLRRIAMTQSAPVPVPPTPFSSDQVGDALRQFAELRMESAEATVDNFVRVRVGGALNVLSVEILDTGIEALVRQRLETAITGAVNTAMQRMAVQAGQALRAFGRQRTREVRPGERR